MTKCDVRDPIRKIFGKDTVQQRFQLRTFGLMNAANDGSERSQCCTIIMAVSRSLGQWGVTCK